MKKILFKVMFTMLCLLSLFSAGYMIVLHFNYNTIGEGIFFLYFTIAFAIFVFSLYLLMDMHKK